MTAYIYRNPPRAKAQGFPDHVGLAVCDDLEFALKLKGILEHLDSAYVVTFRECVNYRPFQTTEPEVKPALLAEVNRWLNEKGFPSLKL